MPSASGGTSWTCLGRSCVATARGRPREARAVGWRTAGWRRGCPAGVRPTAGPGSVLWSWGEELAPLGRLLAEAVDVGPAGGAALGQLAERLATTSPFPDPHYAGQMLKPPHPVAWAAYAAAMLLNPNNHALDGGPATAELERECVDRLAEMLGVAEPRLGHLTSSGTIANLEALWVARELRPGGAVLSGDN